MAAGRAATAMLILALLGSHGARAEDAPLPLRLDRDCESCATLGEHFKFQK